MSNKEKIQGLVVVAVCILLVTACGTRGGGEAAPLKLWYDHPADATVADDPNGWKDDKEWLEALPLGNGSLGAMVFGDVVMERIQLNEESMWSGSPQESDNKEASLALGEIRRLLFEGKYNEATALTNKTQICQGAGSGFGNGANVPFGCFQTLGDLWIDMEKKGGYEEYHRELDLREAIVRVNYVQEGVRFQREIFTSYPDQVLVIRLTSDRPGQISFGCTMTRPERYKTYVDGDQLIMTGAMDDGKGGEGLKYMARLKALTRNGEVRYEDKRLIVSAADEVTLFLSALTDYQLAYPGYKGRDFEALTARNIENAAGKEYAQLKKDHLKEYQAYFDRADFRLGQGDTLNIPTDQRVQRFKESQEDQHLVELMFQYGRYLLISSSRPGTLPANLQGIWANKIQTPWNGDYHTDVNIQMNYWPAEVTNLSEMHLPMFDLIESLVEPGTKTAGVQYGLTGWVVHPITNVWGYTSPGESASWGMHTGAGAWLCTHIGEHYAFTGDKEFLKRMYPTLASAVEFYMDWLVKDTVTGRLVSGPAVSPENTFLAPDGSKCQISMGPAHDQQVIWQLFTDFLYASKELGQSGSLVAEVSAARDALLGPQKGVDGRLMEWAYDFPEVEPGHRHISHLFALHPGNQITVTHTPDLAEAAKKSLDYRLKNGGGHTGWSAAWLVCQFARLGEGDKAEESVNTVLKRSTSPNLFGQHPPFQMDANFGLTAGIAEMLVQSHQGFIELLPALPAGWSSGHIRGLKARGGYEIEMTWTGGKLEMAEISSGSGGKTLVKFQGQVKEIEISPKGTYRLL